MKSLLTASLLVVVFVSVAFGQSTAEWSPELQVKLKTVGAPRVSPDGKRVVYIVSDAVMTPDKSEFVTQIWMAMIDGKTKPNGAQSDLPRSAQLTFGEKSSTNPKWSPDGNWIAFTSTRKDNKSNIYLLNLNGGEAEPLTDVKTGVTNFAWSPDGRSIAFRMADAKTEEEEKNDKAKTISVGSMRISRCRACT